MTKSLNCKAIISEDVFATAGIATAGIATAGIAADALTRTEVAIRGREEPMTVRVADDPGALAGLLDAARTKERTTV